MKGKFALKCDGTLGQQFHKCIGLMTWFIKYRRKKKKYADFPVDVSDSKTPLAMKVSNVRYRAVVQMKRTVKINMINVLRLICVLFELLLLASLLADKAEDMDLTASMLFFADRGDASFDTAMADVTIVRAGTIVVAPL